MDMLNIARCALMKVSLDASLWVVASATLDISVRWQSAFKAIG